MLINIIFKGVIMSIKQELIEFCNTNSEYDRILGHYVNVMPFAYQKKQLCTNEEFNVLLSELNCEIEALQEQYPISNNTDHVRARNRIYQQSYLEYLISYKELHPLIIFGDKNPARFLTEVN